MAIRAGSTIPAAAAETAEAGSAERLIQAASPVLVLASGSATRAALLASAGLVFEAVVSGVDEGAVKAEAKAKGATAAEAALALAELKARAIVRPGAVVVGCDQILLCDGAWFDKPADLPAARLQLQALRARTHTLETATVVMRDGEAVWRHAASPRLTMRPFTDAFLDAYLRIEGATVLSSVGAYRLEGLGVHLFDRIEGEHSAILGLPLMPLLGFLRHCDIIRR